MGQVTGAFQSIAASLTEVRGLVEEVGEGSRQQSNAVAQVAHAVASMERVTQTTAATAEESAAASEERRGLRHLAPARMLLQPRPVPLRGGPRGGEPSRIGRVEQGYLAGLVHAFERRWHESEARRKAAAEAPPPAGP